MLKWEEVPRQNLDFPADDLEFEVQNVATDSQRAIGEREAMVQAAERSVRILRKQVDGADEEHGVTQGREDSSVRVLNRGDERRFDGVLVGAVRPGSFWRGRGGESGAEGGGARERTREV